MKKTLLILLLSFSLWPAASADLELSAIPELSAVPEPVEGQTESIPPAEIPPELEEEPAPADIQPDPAAPEQAEAPEQAAAPEEEPALTDIQPALQKNPLTLPLADREEIEKFRRQYLEPKWTKVLYDALENAIDYRLYVRKALLDAQMPPELEYLPIVESNYKTNAKSKSGALGLWQFMENSVKPFLTLNDYVDERLDPWKETDAALKKLKENYNIFGDWLIAIAAYNCGAGAMTRAIAKLSKDDEKDFWTLCDKKLIPAQTQTYVPKLLAIADLANNSHYFGIEIPLHEEEYEVLYNERNGVFDYVSVSKAYSIATLAQNMRIDQAELKRLNPSFVLGFTHPSASSTIRLPAGTELLARSTLETMEPIDFPVKYTVVKGDSLWGISRRYGCTVSQICELNGIQENAILKIGKILYIPSK